MTRPINKNMERFDRKVEDIRNDPDLSAEAKRRCLSEAYAEAKATYDSYRGRTRLVASEKASVQYRVWHLERRSAPVRYRRVAESEGELVKAGSECLLVVDITRTGRPVYATIKDAVEEALEGTRSYVKPCPFTNTPSAA